MSDIEICDNEYACPMDFIAVFDNPANGIAYNLYQCTKCGMLVKYDVWKHKGTTFLLNDNTVKRIVDD